MTKQPKQVPIPRPTIPLEPHELDSIIASQKAGELKYAENRDGSCNVTFMLRVPATTPSKKGPKKRQRDKVSLRLEQGNWAIVCAALGWAPEPVWTSDEPTREAEAPSGPRAWQLGDEDRDAKGKAEGHPPRTVGGVGSTGAGTVKGEGDAPA